MVLKTALDAPKLRLGLSVVPGHMPAARAGLAGVVGWHGDELRAFPGGLVFQLPSEFPPALVKDGPVEPRFLPHLPTGMFACPRGGGRHRLDLQILDHDQRMVLAERGRGLVQKVTSAVCDAAMHPLHSPFGLVPVLRALDLPTHRPLIAGKSLLVPLEAVEGFDMAPIAQGCETGNPDIDPDCARRRRQGAFNLALRLDGNKPFSRTETDRRILERAQHLTALAIAQPAELWQEYPRIARVELHPLRIAKTLAMTFPFKGRKIGTFLEKILVCPLQILHGLLQHLGVRLIEPPRFGAPLGYQFAQACVTKFFFARIKPRLLQRQCLVVNETARTRETAHVALLFAVRHEFEFEGLKTLHGTFHYTEFIQKAMPAPPSALSILAINGEAFRAFW